MIRVYTSSVIDAPADAVWEQVRDFNGLPQWHPCIADSRASRTASRPTASAACATSARATAA